ATAVEVALKMAFQYWRQKEPPEPRRTRFLALGGGDHGDTLGDGGVGGVGGTAPGDQLGGVSLGGVERFPAMFGPLLFPALRAPAPHCYRCPLGLERPACAMACLDAGGGLLETPPGEVA